MVSNVTSLTGSGLRDWLAQRLSAVAIAVYALVMIVYFLIHPGLTYQQWYGFMSCGVMKIWTLIVLFAFLVHAWIGIWTVTTDYMKCTVVRLSVQALVMFFLLACFFWGVEIVWGLA